MLDNNKKFIEKQLLLKIKNKKTKSNKLSFQAQHAFHQAHIAWVNQTMLAQMALTGL